MRQLGQGGRLALGGDGGLGPACAAVHDPGDEGGDDDEDEQGGDVLGVGDGQGVQGW